MLQLIQENLSRQARALELLSSLLQEEFAGLQQRHPQDVSILELSIQELMRQLTMERMSLRTHIGRTFPGKTRVHEVMSTLTDQQASLLGDLLQAIDRAEQVCAIQADKNRHFALGLYDQSLQLLQQLHQSLEPGKMDVYSRRGRYAVTTQTQPSILRGRM
jgi:hypothetical protein